MNAGDKQRVVDLYNQRLDRYGAKFPVLASGTEERRDLRWAVSRAVGIRDGCSVLDLGCGFGDFSQYLADAGIQVDYEGCDINPRLIDAARLKYPDRKFFVADIQTDRIGKNYDFVVSSGAFNNVMQDVEQYEYIFSILNYTFDLATKGVAIDFMSDVVDYKNDKGPFYYSPVRMLELGLKITRNVELRHDYPLFEFCVYMYPNFEGWNKGGPA